MKQWQSLRNNLISDNSEDVHSYKRFFQFKQGYDIHGHFQIAKSAYNYDVNTMAVKLSLIDITGDIIAKSVRPVVIPHQSDISLIAETLLYLPLRLIGYYATDEFINVNVHLIDDYKEYIYDLPITSTAELIITPPIMHLPKVTLSILPKLTGLT